MYKALCNRLNVALAQFNTLLNEKVIQLPSIEENQYFDLSGKGWWDINLGEVDFAGVYIIVYTDTVMGFLSAYIGKASLSSSIGKRLDTHLYNSKISDSKGFNWYGNNRYIANRVYTLDLSQYPFLAPSLEEFLICELKETETLLNSLGN